jgi:hypothetical protein
MVAKRPGATRVQARRKWCPFTEREEAYAGDVEYSMCLADRCMAWRWMAEEPRKPGALRPPDARGYCGRVGEPPEYIFPDD